MKRRGRLFVPIILWTASIASAQTASGAIQGTISDQDGGIIIGARVTLTEQQTNQTRSEVTNASGSYLFGGVPPGVYRLDVELSRFAKYTVANIPLQVAEART